MHALYSDINYVSNKSSITGNNNKPQHYITIHIHNNTAVHCSSYYKLAPQVRARGSKLSIVSIINVCKMGVVHRKSVSQMYPAFHRTLYEKGYYDVISCSISPK